SMGPPALWIFLRWVPAPPPASLSPLSPLVSFAVCWMPVSKMATPKNHYILLACRVEGRCCLRVYETACRLNCGMNVKLRPAIAGLCLPLLMMAGCGMVAAPAPPSLKLPQPVDDLTAQRTGNEVALHWTMPKRTTDKVLLVGKQRAQVCRRVGSGQCSKVGDVAFAPEASASFVDHLSAALPSGAAQPLVYTVELFNSVGRSAGPSNEAVTAAGTA